MTFFKLGSHTLNATRYEQKVKKYFTLAFLESAKSLSLGKLELAYDTFFGHYVAMLEVCDDCVLSVSFAFSIMHALSLSDT